MEWIKMPAVRRGGWAILDQVFGTLTTAVVSISVAHTVAARGYGVFSLALAAYLVCYGLSQNVGGAPFMIRFAARSKPEQLAQIPNCLGIDLACSVVIGVPLAIIGMYGNGQLVTMFLLVAASLPGEMMQSTWRWGAFVRRRPEVAALSDGLALFIQLSITAGLWIHGVRSPGAYIVAWGSGALVSALAFSLFQRCWPSLRGAAAYIWTHRDLIPNIFGEYVAFMGAGQALPFLLVMFVNLASIGALRAAQVVLGVILTPIQGVAPLVENEAARRHAFAPTALPGLMRSSAVVGSVVIIVYAGALLVLPQQVGEALAGVSWLRATDLVIPLTGVFVGQWLTSVAFTAMRVRSEVSTTLRIRLAASALLIAMSIGGALLSGVLGAVCGMAVASLIAGANSWAVFRRRLRETSSVAA